MNTKDWLEKDYYKVLGVSKDATQAEIKKAFRKLARENHPDQHPGDKKAETRFKEVSEANAVLSDPETRKKYDQQRSLLGSGMGGFFQRSPGGAGGAGTSYINDLFRNATTSASSMNFGDLLGGLFNSGGAREQRQHRRGADIETSVTVSFEEAIKGTTVGVPKVSQQACTSCRGTGAAAGSNPRVCSRCQGSGFVVNEGGGQFGSTVPCSDCRGRGILVDNPCLACQGSGRARSAQTMQVRVPAGVSDGQRVKIKGKGGSGENGGQPGDLYVTVNVRPHPVFGRKGDDVTVTVPITFGEAVLGAEIEVPTLTGSPVKLKVAAGTPNGRVLRIPGRGIARKNGTQGSQLVTLEIAVPDKVSSKARDKLREFDAEVAQPNPRKHLLGGA